MKTNASRILDELGITHEVIAYVGDPTTLPAIQLAAAIGAPAHTIYKTLVVEGDKTGVSIALVSIAETIDLKALAQSMGDKRIALVDAKRLLALTGYVRGGVTALGTKRPLTVTIDHGALAHRQIGVSAGKKGLEILVAPADFVRATAARVAPIASRT